MYSKPEIWREKIIFSLISHFYSKATSCHRRKKSLIFSKNVHLTISLANLLQKRQKMQEKPVPKTMVGSKQRKD